MSILTKYPIKIKIISPVHIGSGEEYYPYEYFFSQDNKKLCIFNLDLFIQKFSQEAVRYFLNREIKPLWQLVNNNYLNKKELIRNINKIQDSTATRLKDWAEKGNAATIWQHIKNYNQEPFIPGSSLKGAIRTAVAYAMLKKSAETYNKVKKEIIKKDKQSRMRSFVGEKNTIENSVFRDDGDAKKDLMRLWSMSDSKPISANETLSVVCGKRLSKSKIFGSLNYEVLTEVELETEFTFNNSLAQSNYLNNDIFSLFPQTINELFECINQFADDIIQWEINYFQTHRLSNQLNDIINFYQELQDRRKNGEVLLSLGKGTGWIKKTVGMLFKQDHSGIFKDIFYAYRLGKRNQPPATFPSSREIIDENKKQVFGWVRIIGE